jgi:AraC family transcriptional regulator
MNAEDPVRKAIWHVARHSGEELSLEAIAAACEVSPSHLTRAFATATGVSLIRYLRARRLSDAARALAGGAPDILELALQAGYGSHEAFTRAFRDRFDLSPTELRDRGSLDGIRLTEAIPLNDQPLPALEPPRIERKPALVLAGLVERHRSDSGAGIPDQWSRFLDLLPSIPARVGQATYGAAFNSDGQLWFDYLCGVEVARRGPQPTSLTALEVPASRMAVFRHHGHVASIRATFGAIFSDWMPTSGERFGGGTTLERYGPEFDSATGLGGLEIWIPLADLADGA